MSTNVDYAGYATVEKDPSGWRALCMAGRSSSDVVGRFRAQGEAAGLRIPPGSSLRALANSLVGGFQSPKVTLKKRCPGLEVMWRVKVRVSVSVPWAWTIRSGLLTARKGCRTSV